MAKKGVKRPLEASHAAAATMEVKRSEVPAYLRGGAFYLALGEEDEDEVDDGPFLIPSDAMKSDATISDSEELIHLLKSLRFWGVDGVMPEVVDFILNNKTTIKLKSSLAAFEPDYPYLFALRKIVRNRGTDVFEIAVEVGNLDLVKYLQLKGVELDEYPSIAARHGHLDCLIYLHENGHPWGVDIVPEAVGGGNVECLKYVHQHAENFSELVVSGNYDYCFVMEKKMLDCVIFLYHNSATVPMKVIADAFLCDGLKSVKYCLTGGIVPDELVISAATKENRLDCVKHLHAQGCPWDLHAPMEAASRGNLPMLKYLHEQGCPWDRATTFFAAHCGWLPCLKYAHEHGCPWDSRTYFNLPVDSVCYKYAEQHGCPFVDTEPWGP